MARRDEEENGKVLNFNDHREKKALERAFSGDRTPLFVSHLDGKIKSSPHLKDTSTSDDFGDRIRRIRTSLEKINTLMTELKKQNRQP